MKYNKDQGQSSVEFLISFILSLSIFWAFVNLTLNYTSGYLVHYATFMAARAYYVADNGSDSADFAYSFARSYAEKTFNAYRVTRFFVKNGRLVINELDGPNAIGGAGGGRRAKMFVGAYYTFNQSFFTSFYSAFRPMTLVSESFLGKEPTRYECKKRICEIMSLKSGGAYNPCSSGMFKHATIFDNGC